MKARRLIDDTFSKGFETVRVLVSHADFTTDLGDAIRAEGGLDRAIRALRDEFFPVAQKPLAAPPPKLWEKINETTVRVNLDYALKLPFAGAEVEWSQGSGWVTVELRRGVLYVEGKKITLWLAEEQKKGTIKGSNLRPQVEKHLVLHPNLMDALVEAWEQGLHLIPESWKVNSQGQTLCIFFWAVGFRDSAGNLHARYLYWNGSRWFHCYNWLVSDWVAQSPAAVSAS